MQGAREEAIEAARDQIFRLVWRLFKDSSRSYLSSCEQDKNYELTFDRENNYWTDIATKIAHETDQLKAKRRRSNKQNPVNDRTILAVTYACQDLGISEELAFWSINKYDDRNSTFHCGLEDLRWRPHHLIIMDLVVAYPAISGIVGAVRKERSVYNEAVQKIEQLWRKKELDYAINQSLRILRNMRKIALRNWAVENAMKIMSKIIDYRLRNSERDVRKKAIPTNDDWVKITTEIFKSSCLLIVTRIVVIMSSSFADITQAFSFRNRIAHCPIVTGMTPRTYMTDIRKTRQQPL